jgi:hypothetical protein
VARPVQRGRDDESTEVKPGMAQRRPRDRRRQREERKAEAASRGAVVARRAVRRRWWGMSRSNNRNARDGGRSHGRQAGRLATEAESPSGGCFTYQFFLHFILFRSKD